MNDPFKNVPVVYTDGACKPNPGTGGYAVVITREGEIQEEFAEGADDTTNNRMELSAVIKAMELLPKKSNAIIVSDSKYVVNTITKGWARNANKDLWHDFNVVQQERRQNIIWWWEKGHAGNRGNERADELAQKAAKDMKEKVDENVLQ
jgi:ribonuclease HI